MYMNIAFQNYICYNAGRQKEMVISNNEFTPKRKPSECHPRVFLFRYVGITPRLVVIIYHYPTI